MSRFLNCVRDEGEEYNNLPPKVETATEPIEIATEGSRPSGRMPEKSLPEDSFVKCVTEREEAEWYEQEDWDQDPDLWLYRKKTTALLRRYMQWSLEAGRVPSLLGRELFRSKISGHSATTFEARILFLHDVEGCLDRLPAFDRQIIGRIVLQEYDHAAAARILQCDRKTLERRLPELIDELTSTFLQAELLERLPQNKEEAL